MPIYEYECSEPSDACDGHFEVFQPMAEDPLEMCPTCNKPCKRIISSSISTTKGTGDILQDKNLKRTGFSMYKNQGDGRYERVAGADGPDRPDVLSADDPRIKNSS